MNETPSASAASERRGAARERVGVSSLVVFDPDDDALGRALDDEPPEDAADAANPNAHEVRLDLGSQNPCKSGGRVSLRVLAPRVCGVARMRLCAKTRP
jgi:hypothetical protein